MSIRAYPVRIEDGEVRSLDGSVLPVRATAVLVILPTEAEQPGTGAEWSEPFARYLDSLRAHPECGVDKLCDSELNDLIHSTRH